MAKKPASIQFRRTSNAAAPKTKLKSKKIRYAVVGLGHISQMAMLPAFTHAKKNSKLVAFVTGDPVKA